ILMPSKTLQLQCGKKTLMGVNVPTIAIQSSEGELYPYSFITVTGELDKSISELNKLVENLINLSVAEKTCNRLADEIEKNKRRVNALENVMIPQMEETVKYISMKLDENERGALVRLMKVKAMIESRTDEY
ncbi:MAG: V-type ATP synthase subunit D, partial [Clostridia bacterium]